MHMRRCMYIRTCPHEYMCIYNVMSVRYVATVVSRPLGNYACVTVPYETCCHAVMLSCCHAVMLSCCHAAMLSTGATVDASKHSYNVDLHDFYVNSP